MVQNVELLEKIIAGRWSNRNANASSLRWLSGHTLRDRIQNEGIRKGLGVANIEEKMKDNRLR